MPTLTPEAGPIDGTETMVMSLPNGMEATFTMSQFRAYALCDAGRTGEANAPAGRLEVPALNGDELVQLMQGGVLRIAPVAQLAIWASTGTAAGYTPPAGDGLGGLPTVSALDGTEAFWIGQAGGTRAVTTASVRAFVTS